MKRFFLPTLCFVLLCSSCQLDTQNKKLILGRWRGTEWLENGQPSNKNATGTSFVFNDKGEYTYDYAGTIEKGTYKVESDKLFTTPANGLEMMVYLKKLTSDSLVFDMSKGGQPETLTLLRQK